MRVHEDFVSEGEIMKTLGQWDICILAPQIFFGFIVYKIASFVGMHNAGEYALVTAGIVASVCVIFAMFEKNTIGVIMATSSIIAVMLVLSLMDGFTFLTGILVFLMFALTFVTALLAEQAGDKNSVWLLILCAIPVVGAVICGVNDALREEKA